MSFKPVPAKALTCGDGDRRHPRRRSASRCAGGKPVECYGDLSHGAGLRHGPGARAVPRRHKPDRRVPAIYGTQKGAQAGFAGARRTIASSRRSTAPCARRCCSIPKRTVARTIPAVTRTTIPPRQGERRRLCLGVPHHQRQAGAVQGEAQGDLRQGGRNRRGASRRAWCTRACRRSAAISDRAVLVAEERQEAVIIPAEYGYSTEQVLIQPEQRTLHRDPGGVPDRRAPGGGQRRLVRLGARGDPAALQVGRTDLRA